MIDFKMPQKIKTKIYVYIISFADMDVLNSCGWCRGTWGDRPGAGKDEGNGGEIERYGSLVDEGSSGEAESPGSGLGVEERLNEGDGGQEGAKENEEGPDGYLKCGKWVGGLLRHAFEEHIPWFVRPDSAYWVCHRQSFLSSNAMRHFKESGHEGFFTGGRLGLWVEGIRKIIERCESRRGWKDWEETLEGMKLLWEKLGVWAGVLGWREEWLGVFFESYVGEGNLEKKEGRFSLKPLKGVGVLSNWRVLLSMMKGEGREEQGDEVRMKGFGVVEWVWHCGEVVWVWLELCNSVWFGISGKLRGREGWWDQVPLERCLIETDAPYLGGGREDIIFSPYFGNEGLGGFCKGINEMKGQGGSYLRVGGRFW